METQNRHNVPFYGSASIKKRKRKTMKKIKQIYKTSKKGNKRQSCHLFPKVSIDLPFEGNKVEGSRKYRRRESVLKAGSRREETITEPINFCIGEFHRKWLQVAQDAPFEPASQVQRKDKQCLCLHWIAVLRNFKLPPSAKPSPIRLLALTHVVYAGHWLSISSLVWPGKTLSFLHR